MRDIKVKVHPSKSNLKKEDQLAWKIAEIASDKAKIDKDAVDMVINRIIDNASVAIASFNRRPVISARAMALAHSRKLGANVFGLNPKIKVDCEWAAWANGTAVRELDYHDTFLAADYSNRLLLKLSMDHLPGYRMMEAGNAHLLTRQYNSQVIWLTITAHSTFCLYLSSRNICRYNLFLLPEFELQVFCLLSLSEPKFGHHSEVIQTSGLV